MHLGQERGHGIISEDPGRVSLALFFRVDASDERGGEGRASSLVCVYIARPILGDADVCVGGRRDAENPGLAIGLSTKKRHSL